MTLVEHTLGMLAQGREVGPSWSGWPAFADAVQEWQWSLFNEQWISTHFARMASGETQDEDIYEVCRELSVPEIAGYDWREAFSYAGEPGCGSPNVGRAKPTDTVSTDPFRRCDVVAVVAKDEGNNDGPDWLCMGRLLDGRWFALKAGCDYTGWG